MKTTFTSDDIVEALIDAGDTMRVDAFVSKLLGVSSHDDLEKIKLAYMDKVIGDLQHNEGLFVRILNTLPDSVLLEYHRKYSK